MADQRSNHELARLIERAVADVCELPRPGLWFCVDEVLAYGRPPKRLEVWATLHFLPEGSPFCCGEPGCHLGLSAPDILQEIGEHLRQAMNLRQEVNVDFGDRIRVNYHRGVEFSVIKGNS
jgi:hypothetical protein